MHLRTALAGGPSQKEDWLAVYDLAEERREHVRFDWRGEEPPCNMYGVRAAAAPPAMELNWTTMFSYRFIKGKHISLRRRITRQGTRRRRLLVLVDSRVVFGAVSKGRSS